jgi:DNA repair protein REV1
MLIRILADPDIIIRNGTAKKEIRERTGCACSVGLGPNILLARLATKRAKPNGQFRLRADQAREVMAELRVTELPGVGRSVIFSLLFIRIRSLLT